MSPMFWGVVIGIVTVHVAYAIAFGIIWWTKIREGGDIPEQVQDDFTRIRESLRKRRN